MSDRLAEAVAVGLYGQGAAPFNETTGAIVKIESSEIADALRAAFQSGPLEDRLALLREVSEPMAGVLREVEALHDEYVATRRHGNLAALLRAFHLLMISDALRGTEQEGGDDGPRQDDR